MDKSVAKKLDMKPKTITVLGFVCLAHPETEQVQSFTIEHAQSILDRQASRNMSVQQCWKLLDTSFVLKAGIITQL